MGKQPAKDGALAVLGQLTWNQLIVHLEMDAAERGQLQAILDGVRSAVTPLGLVSGKAESVTHNLLYLIELDLAQEAVGRKPNNQVVDYREAGLRSRSTSSIDGVLGRSGWGFGDRTARSILSRLALPASPILRHRLTERCLALEFPFAAFDFLRWMDKSGLVSTKKCREIKEWSDQLKQDTDRAIIRIGLLSALEAERAALDHSYAKCRHLVEGKKSLYEGMRRVLADERYDGHPDGPFSAIHGLVNEWEAENPDRMASFLPSRAIDFQMNEIWNKDYVTGFMTMMNGVIEHTVNLPSVAGWVGMLGSVLAEKEIRLDVNRERAVYYETKKTESSEYSSDATHTAQVAQALKTRHFAISARTIYNGLGKLDRFRALTGIYRRRIQDTDRLVMPWEKDQHLADACEELEARGIEAEWRSELEELGL